MLKNGYIYIYIYIYIYTHTPVYCTILYIYTYRHTIYVPRLLIFPERSWVLCFKQLLYSPAFPLAALPTVYKNALSLILFALPSVAHTLFMHEITWSILDEEKICLILHGLLSRFFDSYNISNLNTSAFTHYFFLWRWGPTWAIASSFMTFLDHSQRRTTVGRTPPYEWSSRRRNLYLTTHSTHNRHPCPCGTRTHNLSRRTALDRAASGTCWLFFSCFVFILFWGIRRVLFQRFFFTDL